jgi:hypothetical protein
MSSPSPSPNPERRPARGERPRCTVCGESFNPVRNGQRTCRPSCAQQYAQQGAVAEDTAIEEHATSLLDAPEPPRSGVIDVTSPPFFVGR